MNLIAECSRNIERNGVEIRFNMIPDDEIRNQLKQNKWRYSKYNKCWYIYYTEKNLLFAKEICKPFTVATRTEKSSCDYFGKSLSKYSGASTMTQGELEYYGRAVNEPLGVYKAISPSDYRYKKRRSFFS